MARIFISYARDDGSKIARELANKLRAGRNEVFLDKDSIIGSEEWHNILKSRTRWADLLIVLVTSKSNASDYVYEEITQSQKAGKSILPVQINDIELPVHLRKYQAIRLDNENYDFLLLEIRRVTDEIIRKRKLRNLLIRLVAPIILLIIVIAFAISANISQIAKLPPVNTIESNNVSQNQTEVFADSLSPTRAESLNVPTSVETLPIPTDTQTLDVVYVVQTIDARATAIARATSIANATTEAEMLNSQPSATLTSVLTETPTNMPTDEVFMVSPKESIGANLRSGPGKRYPVRRSLPFGNNATVIGYATDSNSNLWWELMGGEWVRADLVAPEIDQTKLPEVTSPAYPITIKFLYAETYGTLGYKRDGCKAYIDVTLNGKSSVLGIVHVKNASTDYPNKPFTFNTPVTTYPIELGGVRPEFTEHETWVYIAQGDYESNHLGGLRCP